MKQLNNLNGNIIIIDQINKETGRTVYSEYENIVYNTDGTVRKKFTTKKQAVKIINLDYSVIPDVNLTIQENNEKVTFDALILELNDNWTASDELQNWIYSEKPYRVIVSNIKNNKEILTNAPYHTLMNSMLVLHEGFIDINNINTVLYVNSLQEGDMSIIAPFINSTENPEGWIYIEEKL